VCNQSMLVSGEFNPQDLHRSVSLNSFLIQLQSPYFKAIPPSLYRCHFGRWALQTSLLNKTCNFLHLVDLPNLSKDSLQSTLDYLRDHDRLLPEIWLWIGEHESILVQHSRLLDELRLRDDGLVIPPSSLPYLWILDLNYENIAHEAIHLNRLRFLSSLAYLPHAFQINQRNIDLNSPCHLAIIQQKLDLALVLVNSPNIDLTVKDRNLRTPLHLLLFLSLQKIQKKVFLLEKNVATITLQIVSRDTSLFFLPDGQGHSPLDYALMIGKIPILSCLFSHHLLPPIADYSSYLYQSLRLNQPPLVNYFAQLYLNCDAVIKLLNTSDLSGQILSDLLCYCIQKNHLKSLLVLLSKKQFVCAVNSFTSGTSRLLFGDRFSLRDEDKEADKRLPLHYAVDAMKFCGRIDPFRILDKFGVHVNVATQEQRQPNPPSGHSFIDLFQTWLVRYDHSRCSSHDNIFSYLCVIQSSPSVHQSSTCSSSELLSPPEERYFQHLHSVERNAITLLRELFFKNHSLRCYLTNTSRKYQSAERWERATESVPSERTLSFYWNSFSFQCNPLVTAVLSSQSQRTRLPPWQAYHRHTFHLNQLEVVRLIGYPLLDYLLTHTPFSELINAQEARSHLTPLAAACLAGNKSFIELLCRHGAQRNMKLNAYHLSESPILLLTSSPLRP
jgi:ankyrin repeat protein